MNEISGQCFGCYDDATFKYIGQTKEYNPKQVQLDYVNKLKKPVTIVKCSTCEKVVRYTEKNGFWKLRILE